MFTDNLTGIDLVDDLLDTVLNVTEVLNPILDANGLGVLYRGPNFLCLNGTVGDLLAQILNALQMNPLIANITKLLNSTNGGLLGGLG